MEATPEELMEFDRQFDKMMSEAMQGASVSRTVNTDIRIPLNHHKNVDREEQLQPRGTISYAVLLKKGNKANIRHVDIPENAEFVQRMRRREAVITWLNLKFILINSTNSEAVISH